MKKYIFIVIIILITIVLNFIISNKILKKESILFFYQLTEKEDKISDRTMLQSNNLKITLRDFCNNGINEDNFLNLGLTQEDINKIISYKNNGNCLIEFTTVDGTNISEVSYDYLIYDNNKNILTTTITYEKNLSQINYFIQNFVKNNYNSNNINEFSEHFLHLNTSNFIIKSTEKSILSLFTWNIDENKKENEIDMSKIHIVVINPRYRNFENNMIYLENTFFEFILEN